MNDFNELIKSDKPVLVDFFATWCGPCKMQSPILDDVKSKVGDTATIVKVDVDKAGPIAAQYRVQSVPTLIIFKKGEPVWRASGVHSADDLVELIKRHSETHKADKDDA